MPAYDECYLDSMYQKHRYLFKLIARNSDDAFGIITILEWMADIYTYIQWKYNVLSSDMIKKIKPDELYLKYHPLHEASIENGAEKLRKIYQF